MLSDEERQAIVELNHFSNMTAYWKQEEYTNSEIDNYIKFVLNLIEKQSKEIEELNKSDESKEQSSMKYYNLYKELVDKIKAKIEGLQEDIKYSANPLSIDNSKFGIKVLQSLLEKE